MKLVQITPGAGGMYCGNCFRDNALVRALRNLGHDVVLVPLYLPMRLEDEDQSAGTPIFFGGINVYLEQKSAFFRKAPGWLRDVLASPALLKWAADKAAKTRAADVGDLTLSMLRGEEGNQARELEELIAWLRKESRPDVISLSNVLLAGLARKLKSELGARVVCSLQGEDTFLDALPENARYLAWKLVTERARDIDLFVAPSRYFAGLMQNRLGLPEEKVKVAHNGIDVQGFTPATPGNPPILGYFARMCREKGLDLLVEAYILLRERFPSLRLAVGGGCGPSDEPFVASLREQLACAGALEQVEFFPNIDRAGKQQFFRKLSVFSVPALYGEAFGLYILEALASAVPVVQPRHAAFEEIVAATGGGVIVEPRSAAALANGLAELLDNPDRRRMLGARGRQAVLERFTSQAMAERIADLYQSLL